MRRLIAFAAALALAAGAAEAAPAAAHLERVVIVTRHGVRPPTSDNDALAKYSDQAWPAWTVAPGELTPHGAETVYLMGRTLRQTYVRAGLLAAGCAPAGAVSVWADGVDQRTRESGHVLADALDPGCGLGAPFTDVKPRDPVFGGSDEAACKIDPDQARAAQADIVARFSRAPSLAPAVARLQAIMAPKACSGGAGMCFDPDAVPGAAAYAAKGQPMASLAEDLLLEYTDGKPLSDVGWGRAAGADIAAVMPLHERSFALQRANTYVSSHFGAPMARVVLAAMAGQPAPGGPESGPDLKVMVLAGHDTNLVWMSSLFGLDWTLPGEPDGTAPSSALAFEVWRAGAQRFVRPVIYYETLDQLRTLKPAAARALPLTIKGCATGPMGSCPLPVVRQRVEKLLPADCFVK